MYIYIYTRFLNRDLTMINRKLIGFNLLILRDTQVVQRQDVSCFRDLWYLGKPTQNSSTMENNWNLMGYHYIKGIYLYICIYIHTLYVHMRIIYIYIHIMHYCIYIYGTTIFETQCNIFWTNMRITTTDCRGITNGSGIWFSSCDSRGLL